MATSLAEQLKRLSVPQTSLLKDDKKKPSLLFDPKEAASLRKETVYQIGLEGLEELISKNVVFEQFKKSLFHITSQNFERAVQTNEANEKVNKTIDKFLLLLSPYFLLSSAHKALEWLINRYMINEFNRQELLMLALPYHESNIFIRIIQTVKFKNQNDVFFFLKSLQKPGLHLPKQNLLNNAVSNIALLKCVTKWINELFGVHENPNILVVAFNFYCTIFCGCIEYSSEVREDQISQMLPLILKGLGSQIPDFAAASYVITARLLVKTTLAKKLLNKILQKISEIKCSSLKMEATLVMLVIYQSQRGYENMPPVAVANLSEKEWLSQCLEHLNANGNYIYPFLKVLLRRSTDEGVNNDLKLPRDLVISIFDTIKLDDSFVENILCLILDTLSPEMKYSEEAKQWLCDVIQKLDHQYPSIFDKEVHKIFSSGGGNKIRQKRKVQLQKILENTATYKGKFEMFNKLFHPEESIREEALKYLIKNFDNLKPSEQELIKSSIIDKLKNKNPKIVKNTLNFLANTKFVTREMYENVLINLSKESYLLSEEWNKVFIFTVKLLCENQVFDWKIFLIMFPYLVLYASKYSDQVKSILTLEYFTKHKLFDQFSKEIVKTPKNGILDLLLKCLSDNNDVEVVKELLNTLNSNTYNTCLGQYCSIYVLSLLLPNSCDLEISTHVLEIIVTLQNSTVNTSLEESTLVECIKICLKNKLPVKGLKMAVMIILKKSVSPKNNLKTIDITSGNSESMFLKSLCLLTFSKNLQNEYIESYLEHLQYTSVSTQIIFLLNVSSSGAFSDSITLSALECVYQTIKNNKNNSQLQELFSLDNMTVPYLLVLLAQPEADIRKLILKILDFLLKISVDKIDSYTSVAKGLLRQREEIMTDNEQVAIVLKNLIKKSSIKDPKSALSTLLNISCETETPIYLKAGILLILSHVNNYEIFEKVSTNLISLLQQTKVVDKHTSTICTNIINRLEVHVAAEIILQSNVWEFIKYALKCDTEVQLNNQFVSLSVLMLNQINKEVYSALKEDVLENLLDIICEISTFSRHPEILTQSSKIFKHLDLDAKLISKILEKMKDAKSPLAIDPSKKKRRINITPTVDILDTLDWKKGICLLEFLQDKKKVRNCDRILALVFDILKKCLEFEEQAAVEYPKQLVLSLVLLICSKTDSKPIPENLFNIELVIQCIRASHNPQTHHHALLVLANAALIVPTQVLHHIMTIFTFMGSSLLRHDDAYSFQIISKIIDTIIPILVNDENHATTISKVLRVFVDAMLDVPEHRRVLLYNQLLNRVDAKENMSLFLLLTFEAQVLHSHHEKQKSEKGVKAQRIQILTMITMEFPPEIILHSCTELIKYLKQLPDEKEESMDTDAETETFNIGNHTEKEFRHYKYIIITFITNLISSQQFVNKIATLTEQESLNLEQLFKEFIINTLNYLQRVQKLSEKLTNTPQAQYWKIMLHHSYDILDGINALLTSQMFLLVIKGLMMHNLTTVRRRALELLNSKLQHNSEYFSDCEKEQIYILISPIISTIELLNQGHIDADEEILIQTALLSLKLLVRAFAPKDPENFVQILEFITKMLHSGHAENNVLASVILCLAELCATLRAHAISSLPNIMPVFLKIFKKLKHLDIPNLLLQSMVTALNKLLESLALFLSPYLKKIIFEISILASKWNSISNDQKSLPLINKLTGIKQKISTLVPYRVLMPAVEEGYHELLEKKYFHAVSELMDILGETLKHFQLQEITPNLPNLTNFFSKALQFRCDNGPTLENANLVEQHIIKAFTTLILKLSENTFRPIYFKLYDWAVRIGEKSERLITFYNLSMTVAESLKGLFVLFAGHFFNNAAEILTSINSIKGESYYNDDAKDILLLEYVLKTLRIVFLHDNQKFINRNRFDLLMQPLVDQLENTMTGIENLTIRNEKLVTPTIISFLIAVADDALWKQMNYQILLKTRNSVPEIRLVALHCLTEVVINLGEDFLPLLPETIPFLAELLEDEEERVEKTCQKSIREMEKVLGEPLQKYF